MSINTCQMHQNYLQGCRSETYIQNILAAEIKNIKVKVGLANTQRTIT